MEGAFVSSRKFLGDDSNFVHYVDANRLDDVLNGSRIDERVNTMAEKITTPMAVNSTFAANFKIDSNLNILIPAKKEMTPSNFRAYVSSLPNQIKALFLMDKDYVKTNFADTEFDPFISMNTQFATNINYFKLVRIEVFDGFEKGANGNYSLSRPIWREISDADLGHKLAPLFCRLARYSDNHLKLDRDTLSLPIANKYFMIKDRAGDLESVRNRSRYRTQSRLMSIAIMQQSSMSYDISASTSNIIQQSTANKRASLIDVEVRKDAGTPQQVGSGTVVATSLSPGTTQGGGGGMAGGGGMTGGGGYGGGGGGGY